jgi:hypothetical protein
MIDFSSNKKPEEKKPDETPKPPGMFLAEKSTLKILFFMVYCSVFQPF